MKVKNVTVENANVTAPSSSDASMVGDAVSSDPAESTEPIGSPNDHRAEDEFGSRLPSSYSSRSVAGTASSAPIAQSKRAVLASKLMQAPRVETVLELEERVGGWLQTIAAGGQLSPGECAGLKLVVSEHGPLALVAIEAWRQAIVADLNAVDPSSTRSQLFEQAMDAALGVTA